MASNIDIRNANVAATRHIEQYYNEFRRENILDLADGYTEEDRTKFRVFRDKVRARCKEYEDAENPVINYDDINP